MNAHNSPPPPFQGSTHNHNICDRLHTFTQWANLKNILHYKKKTTEKWKQEEQLDDLYKKNPLKRQRHIQFVNEQHLHIHFKNVSFVVNQCANGDNEQCGDLMFGIRHVSQAAWAGFWDVG